jgi:hypothetical protein
MTIIGDLEFATLDHLTMLNQDQLASTTAIKDTAASSSFLVVDVG